MALKNAVAGGLYDKLKEENEELKEEMAMWKASYDDDIREAREEGNEELKAENERLQKEIDRMSQDCVERCWLAESEETASNLREELKIKTDCYSKLYHQFNAEHNRLLDERVKFSEKMEKVSKALGIEWHGEYQDIINKALKIRQEKKSAKLSNAQKTKVIHKARKELKELNEEFDAHKGKYFLSVECEECNLILTEDDIYGSVECGHLRCEECRDKKSADDCVCITCDCKFSDVEHKAKMGMEKRYAWYFGSEHDDGDMCSRCVRKLYKQYH